MNNYYIKISIIAYWLLVLASFKIQAQSSTDAKSMFKMWLFLDKENVSHYNRIKVDNIKNTDLFSIFDNVTDIQIDTLKSTGFDDYSFYYLHLNNIKTLRELNEDETQSLSLFSGKLDSLILGLNNKTGKSYRLHGFNGNDFLQFLMDIAENDINFPSKNILKEKKYFLKNFDVEKIDFNCLFEFLNSKNVKRDKYPCLYRYSDPLISR